MNLRLLYLYLFSFVGLLIVVIGGIQLVNLGLKMTVFKDADRYYIAVPTTNEKGVVIESKEDIEKRQTMEMRNQRQRELTNSISMLVVGAPLYLYHWKLIKKETKK